MIIIRWRRGNSFLWLFFRIHLIFPECTPAMTRLLPAVVLPAGPLLEMAGPLSPLPPPALLSSAPDITEDRDDLNSGEADSLGLTSPLVSDSKKKHLKTDCMSSFVICTEDQRGGRWGRSRFDGDRRFWSSFIVVFGKYGFVEARSDDDKEADNASSVREEIGGCVKKHFTIDSKGLWKIENSSALDGCLPDFVKVDRSKSYLVLMARLFTNPLLILSILLE